MLAALDRLWRAGFYHKIYMPKTIDHYRKSASSDQSATSSRSKLVPLLILTVTVWFAVSIGIDAYRQIAASHQNTAEQARLCLVEFHQKKCDGLSPSPDCSKLLPCIQLQNSAVTSQLLDFVSACSQEILDDYQLPTVLIGLLLLFNLCQTNGGSRDADHHQ